MSPLKTKIFTLYL